jgi:hypothetical protein
MRKLKFAQICEESLLGFVITGTVIVENPNYIYSNNPQLD